MPTDSTGAKQKPFVRISAANFSVDFYGSEACKRKGDRVIVITCNCECGGLSRGSIARFEIATKRSRDLIMEWTSELINNDPTIECFLFLEMTARMVRLNGR